MDEIIKYRQKLPTEIQNSTNSTSHLREEYLRVFPFSQTDNLSCKADKTRLILRASPLTG